MWLREGIISALYSSVMLAQDFSICKALPCVLGIVCMHSSRQQQATASGSTATSYRTEEMRSPLVLLVLEVKLYASVDMATGPTYLPTLTAATLHTARCGLRSHEDRQTSYAQLSTFKPLSFCSVYKVLSGGQQGRIPADEPQTTSSKQ